MNKPQRHATRMIDSSKTKKKWYPVTFDITLTEAMDELNLTPENVLELKKLADIRAIASGTFGQEVYLRRHQIERHIVDGK